MACHLNVHQVRWLSSSTITTYHKTTASIRHFTLLWCMSSGEQVKSLMHFSFVQFCSSHFSIRIQLTFFAREKKFHYLSVLFDVHFLIKPIFICNFRCNRPEEGAQHEIPEVRKIRQSWKQKEEIQMALSGYNWSVYHKNDHVPTVREGSHHSLQRRIRL